jgi:uncharacterized OB-fold protein
VGVLIQLAQEGEVFSVTVVMVAGDLRGVAIGYPAGLLLEFPPVAVAIVAFDLMRRARRPPEETLGKPAV